MDYINKEENQNEKETESPLRLVFGDATLGVCGNAGNFHYIFSYCAIWHRKNQCKLL